jgi:hypothetical protein
VFNEFLFGAAANAADEFGRKLIKVDAPLDFIGGISVPGIINPTASGTFIPYYYFWHGVPSFISY